MIPKRCFSTWSYKNKELLCFETSSLVCRWCILTMISWELLQNPFNHMIDSSMVWERNMLSALWLAVSGHMIRSLPHQILMINSDWELKTMKIVPIECPSKHVLVGSTCEKTGARQTELNFQAPVYFDGVVAVCTRTLDSLLHTCGEVSEGWLRLLFSSCGERL